VYEEVSLDSEIRATHGPHPDTDVKFDGKRGRVIAQLPEPEDQKFHLPVDDSVEAMEVAIAARDEDGVDPYMGDTTNNLMKTAIDVDGRGGGGKGKKKSPHGGQASSDSSDRTATDGRLERGGRPPKGDEVREPFSTSIAPETRNALLTDRISVAAVLDEIADRPDVRAYDAQGDKNG
jgi:hypothetical protein